MSNSFRRRTIQIVAVAIFVSLAVATWFLKGNAGSLAQLAQASADLQSAEACLEQTQLEAAQSHCQRALEALDVLAPNSRDPRIRFQHAAALETMARIASAIDRPDQADAFFRKAIAIWSKLLGTNQADSTTRWRLAKCLKSHASLLSDLGRWEEAEKALDRGNGACLRQPARTRPDERVDRERVSIENDLGLLYLQLGQFALALEHLPTAVSAQIARMTATPGGPDDIELLISLHCTRARTSSAAHQPAAALQALAEARTLAERLTDEHPSTVRYQDLLAMVLERQASAVGSDQSKTTELRALLVHAATIRESLAARLPAEPEYTARLATTYGKLAEHYLSANDVAQAERFARKQVACWTRLNDEHPGIVAYRFGRGRALHNLADLLCSRASAAEEALKLEREAAALLTSVYREDRLDPDYRRGASFAHWLLCTLELGAADHRRAAQVIDFYQSIEPSGFEESHEAAGFLCRCITLCRDDRKLAEAEKATLMKLYADRAIAALEAAVGLGYRDLHELTSSKLYHPIRDRPEFAQITKRVTEINQALPP